MASIVPREGVLLTFPGTSSGQNPGGDLTSRPEEGGNDLPDCSVGDAEVEAYDEVFDRLTEKVRVGDRFAAWEREVAPICFAQLITRSSPERIRLIRQEKEFHSYLLAEMFIERSRENWFEDALVARESAEAALEIARRLDTEFYGAVLKRGLEARCLAYLANAFKIEGNLGKAREIFERVDAMSPERLLDSYEWAEILFQKASLLKDTGDLEGSSGILDELTSIYSELGDDHKLGRTLIQRGIVQVESGDLAAGISHFSRSLELVDDSRDPNLMSCALANLAYALNDAGRSEEALSVLRISRRRIEESGGRLNLARNLWTEGRIAASMGRLDKAAESFEEVRQFFLDREGDTDAALVCLDLAVVYVRENRTDKVKQLAQEMVPIFRRQGLGREVMAALILFQHAAEKEIATLGLIQEIARYLEKAAQNPISDSAEF